MNLCFAWVRVLLSALTCLVLFAQLELSIAVGQSVEADKVIEDDVYLFGDEVTIDGEIHGDLVVFGRVITLNGTVRGDFIAAGQAIVVNGHVTDDIRIAGQVLKIGDNAVVDDDLIAAAFSLETADSSSVAGDLRFAGYQALLRGDTGLNAAIAAANCEIAGAIGGDAKISVDPGPAGLNSYTKSAPQAVPFPDVPVGLTIRDTARIDGSLEYESPDQANIDTRANITGEIDYRRREPPHRAPADRVWSGVRRFVTLLIVGLVLLLIAPAWLGNLSDTVKARPLASMGLGLIGIPGVLLTLLFILVVMIAVSVLAGFLTLNGLIPVVIIPGLTCIGLLAVGFWFGALYVAPIIVSLMVGRRLCSVVKPSVAQNRFIPFLVGLLLVTVITSIPGLGPVFGWVVVFLGLGVLVLWVFGKIPPARVPSGKPEPATQ